MRPEAYHEFVGDGRRCEECNLLYEEHLPFVVVELTEGYIVNVYPVIGETDVLFIDYDEFARGDPEHVLPIIENYIERLRLLRDDPQVERTVQSLLELRDQRIEETQ